MTYVDPSGHYVAEPGGSFDTIEYGDKGYRVTQVQNGLNVWTATKGQAVDKYLPFIKADGDFGPKTKESVNVFKNVNDIYNKYSSNGVVDEITWKALKPYMGQSSGTGMEPRTPAVQSNGGDGIYGEVFISPLLVDANGQMDVSFKTGKIEFGYKLYDGERYYVEYFKLYDGAEEDRLQQFYINTGTTAKQRVQNATAYNIYRRAKHAEAVYQLSMAKVAHPDTSGLVFEITAGEFAGALLSSSIKGISALSKVKILGGGYKVTQSEINTIKTHLSQFDDYAPNNEMIMRLEKALQKGQKITGADANFYLHELKEAELMASGFNQQAAHRAALEFYKVSDFSVYHPEVIKNNSGWFNDEWFDFWGMSR
jgi:peptidoglycan hydrolase-like protein with peptidoglycan-binding domain/ribosomal protein L30E